MQQYLGFTAGVYGQFEHELTALIAKNSKKRAERSERLMWAGHRDYLLWLSASSSACHGLLIITVITPFLQSPARQKCQGPELANAAITDVWTRQRDVAALDAKYTKELADTENDDALRDDVAAGRRRLHIKAVIEVSA